MVKPYLPDIICNCVGRVNAALSSRNTDPFDVFFDKGILVQVKRSVYNAQDKMPLVWLVMKYDEIFGDFRINSVASFQLIITMPTKNEYTQQEREDNTFNPRLIPVYNQLLFEIGRERMFSFKNPGTVKHIKTLLPYWGLSGDASGNGDVPNLWQIPEFFIDAISVTFNSVVIKKQNCNTQPYPVVII